MNHFFSRPGFSFDEEEQQQKQQNGVQQKMDTRRPNSSTSLFGDMDYSSGGIQYRHGNGGSQQQQQQQQQQQHTRNRSKSFSCEPPQPPPPPAESASELPKSPKHPKVTFADDEENQLKNSDQKQQQQQQQIDTREELVKRLQQNLASWKKQSNAETVADSTASNRYDTSSSVLQHAQNGGGENQHTFSSQQLAAMKTVVYLDLKTTTAEEFDEEEAAAKAACPVCSLNQPLAHWHYLLPSRATYQLQALPVLVDALPSSCSVCARVPRGGSGSGLKLCSKCRAVVYCSEECQLEDWRRGHGRQCEKEEGRKVVKSFGEVDCLEGENNGGHFNGSGGQQQQQQQQQFFGRGSQHPYRGHQQQFFTRQRVRSEMYPNQQQGHQQHQGPPRSDDFFLNRFNNQRNSSNQQVQPVQPTNQTAPSVPAAAPAAPVSATAPAQTAPVPVSSTPAPKAAPAPVSEPTPSAPKAAPPAPVAATAPKITETTTTTTAKYQLKPMPLEAMQHAELKDVTNGPWKRGGLKDTAMEVPAFPKEFLEDEKEEKEKEEEQVNNNKNSANHHHHHHHQPNRERSPAAPRAIPEATKKAEPLQSLQIPSTSSPPPVSPFAEKYFDGVVSKLPHFQLTTGKAYSLMPVELEESVDRKRISFYVGYRDFIGKLMVEINKLAPQCAQVEMADIEAGDVYLVKYDSEWFRGQVLRITSTSFYVDYFDFGNRKYVDRREVAAVAGKGGGGGGYFRQLPPSIGIKRQPPMAIRVQVRNIPSFQQYNLVKRLVTEGIHKHTLLKLFVLEYCPETDCYTVQLDEI